MSALRREVLRDLVALFDRYTVGGNRTHGETTAYREAIRLYGRMVVIRDEIEQLQSMMSIK